MHEAVLEKRVDKLEEAMMELIYQSRKTEMKVEKLAEEMKAFKEEMLAFKDEMLAFKDEMRAFKDEMRAFKDEMRAFKDEMLAFKDEMKVFKDEMKVFKDEMKVFKDEMLDFKDEMRVFKDEMRVFKDEINKKWGELANSLGRLAEDIVAPGIPHAINRCFGLDVTEISVRRRKKRGNIRREYDVIAVASDYVFVVDVKSTYRVKDFDDFQEALNDFLYLFPEYEKYTVVPVVASMYLNEDVVEAATHRRWLALQLSGDYLDFVNKEVFPFKGD
ncbi:MAG: hypothetical protein ACP5TY_00610 [Thermodesulforhabdaceae bacterium]